MADVNHNPASLATNTAAHMPAAPTGHGAAAANTALSHEGTAQANNAGAARLPEGLFNPNATANTNNASAVSEQETLDTKAEDMSLPLVTRFSRAGVSLLELGAALPLIFSSLVSQAKNIIAQEHDSHNSFVVNYMTTAVGSLSSVFRWAFDKVVPQAKHDGDITINKRAFALDDLLSRTWQPAFVHQVTSFIFTMRRALFAFFPNILSVPAEEHDPSKPNGSTTSGFKANTFRAMSSFLSPFRVISSLVTAGIALPAHALGAWFAYDGNQKPYEFTKLASSISDYLMPLTTNLNSLYKVTKAYFDSWAHNMHTGLAFDKYNINFLHVVQGVLGSITSVPYFFGVLLKIKDLLLKKDPEDPRGQQFLLANKARDFIGDIPLEFVSLKLLPGGNIATAQAKIQNWISIYLEYIQDYSKEFSVKLMNATPWIRAFFSKFHPTDISGKVLPGHSAEIVEASDPKDNHVFNIFKKTDFFNEIYDVLHPIQSALMILPNAFVNQSDVYVQDNGTKYLRWLDRLIGVNSMVLSLPNFMIYMVKTRIPQIYIKCLQLWQRKNDLEGRSYDAYARMQKHIAALRTSGIPGSNYLANTLESLNLKPNDFHNQHTIKACFDKLNAEAANHEQAVKASELVTAMRIGMRHIIGSGNRMFYAKRNEQGYTAEEVEKNKVYESMGKFSTTVKGLPIPFLGTVAGGAIEMLRSMYKVQPRENLKRLNIGGSKPAPILAP